MWCKDTIDGFFVCCVHDVMVLKGDVRYRHAVVAMMIGPGGVVQVSEHSNGCVLVWCALACERDAINVFLFCKETFLCCACF